MLVRLLLKVSRVPLRTRSDGVARSFECDVKDTGLMSDQQETRFDTRGEEVVGLYVLFF